jgi:hypothetical protein
MKDSKIARTMRRYQSGLARKERRERRKLQKAVAAIKAHGAASQHYTHR